jgi:cytosine deaminase
MLDILLRRVNIGGQLLDVGIAGDTITKVEPHITDSAHKELDGNGQVAIPGFADCHLHLDKSLLMERSSYQDVSGPEKGALTRVQKETFTEADITARAEKVIQTGLRAGNLIIRTSADVDPLVGLAGVRALLGLKKKYAGLVNIQVAAFAQEGLEKYSETEGLLREALELGADLVGGHTIVDADGRRHIDTILGLAREYGVEAEFHLDESGNREHYLLPYVMERMKETGLQGRVAGIHCCTLSALSPEERREALEAMVDCSLKVISAPTAISTRNLAPVKELLAAGVPVGIGSDNVGDFFNPIGSGDIKQVALLLAYVQRFFTSEQVGQIWDMLTHRGAFLLGYQGYGISVGNRADITVFGAHTPREVLSLQAAPVVLIRGGRDHSERILSNW